MYRNAVLSTERGNVVIETTPRPFGPPPSKGGTRLPSPLKRGDKTLVPPWRGLSALADGGCIETQFYRQNETVMSHNNPPAFQATPLKRGDEAPNPPQRGDEEGFAMKKDYFQHYGSTLQEQARDLRKNHTEPERKLWFCFLREQRPKFSCQKVVGPYILDFFCPELLLAIELDGESHTETVEHDRLRTAYLEEQNIKVLRFTNQDVMKRFDAVCEAIYKEILVPPPQGAVSEADWGLCRNVGLPRERNNDINEANPPAAYAATPL